MENKDPPPSYEECCAQRQHGHLHSEKHPGNLGQEYWYTSKQSVDYQPPLQGQGHMSQQAAVTQQPIPMGQIQGNLSR